MKKKELQGLRTKKQDELQKMLVDLKSEIIKAKADIITSREKNFKKVKNLRHNLSQLLTIIKEHEIMEKEEKKKVDKK